MHKCNKTACMTFFFAFPIANNLFFTTIVLKIRLSIRNDQ